MNIFYKTWEINKKKDNTSQIYVKEYGSRKLTVTNSLFNYCVFLLNSHIVKHIACFSYSKVN